MEAVMPVKTFKATAKLGKGLAIECEARGHIVMFDEEKIFGGGDLGMTPIEATMSALGACQCIIARMFARNKEIDLQGLRMELEGDLVVASLDQIAEGNASMRIQEIRSKVYIKSSSPEEKVRAFAEFIENNCPVADILKNPAQMIPEVIIEKD
jgi:uncharacterized OsmC-like protein